MPIPRRVRCSRPTRPLGQYATTQSMTSSRMLVQVVRAIQETSKIVASRGVDLRRYRSKMLAYRMPISPSVNIVASAPILIFRKHSHPTPATKLTKIIDSLDKNLRLFRMNIMTAFNVVD